MTSSHKPSPILSVNPGETLALVGPVMSHNSTVLSLVEKIHNPTAHCLLLDGVDICELNTKWLQRQFSIISRYPVVFNMTVFDNIRYGVNYRHVRKDEIISVAKSAGVHDILQSLPQVSECTDRNSLPITITYHYTITIIPLPLYHYHYYHLPLLSLTIIPLPLLSLTITITYHYYHLPLYHYHYYHLPLPLYYHLPLIHVQYMFTTTIHNMLLTRVQVVYFVLQLLQLIVVVLYSYSKYVVMIIGLCRVIIL